MDNNTIERIKASINRQIDLHGQYVYKGLKEKISTQMGHICINMTNML